MSQREKIFIWGASGHAHVVTDILELTGAHDIVGYLDDTAPERKGKLFLGAPILGGRETFAELKASGACACMIGIGHCRARMQLAHEVQMAGFRLIQAIHPSAIIARDVRVGLGTTICAGAVINPGVSIGDNVIVNTRASIDHHCMIHDGVHVCPGVTLAGHVNVGSGTWIGIGSTVIEKRSIGEDVLVAAGSVVIRDIPSLTSVGGVPARAFKRASPS